ncbi:hypothetical protein V1T75_10830 [Tenacibaculum sp. FZY0031]|uniref:DUF6934 family protein n=1 Tax=unclassified Tenacibaculum TaxID=2635139 RepID=UPI002EB9374C|nr:hypothetical protein [Tenacibaculum sp. FZY0031]
MIKIDLDDTFDANSASEDLSRFTFNSELKNEAIVELHVLISKHPDPLLPDVYNLAFGPLGDDNEIDDEIILSHRNVNKVFSTVLLFAITFLENNRDENYFIGIDGSNEIRANLYHRMFRYNYNSLSDTIVTVGVDWYVKLLRNGTDIERDSDGIPLFKPRPEPFDLNRSPKDLYRYYMFSLNN